MNTNNSNDDRKFNRRKNLQKKKFDKSYEDEDSPYHQKLNKEFKRHKQQLLEEEEDWNEWTDHR